MFNYFGHYFFIIFQILFISVWQFNLEKKFRQEVWRLRFNVLRAFALKMRKLPRLYDVGCFPKCRSAIFAICDGIFAIIINPWFTLVFSICGGLWNSLINYWYYCFIKLQNWIGGISNHLPLNLSLPICSYRGQSALSNLCHVGLSPTVEFMLSRIMGKLSFAQRSSWTFYYNSRRSDGSATVRSIAE